MISTAADLARRLARDAEAVCRYYLSNGHRSGHYWIVGDVHNTPGRSLYVRLSGPQYGPGAAGKWTDYVAPVVMLRPGAGRLFCQGSAGSAQHNLLLGRVA
jgi:hypothetical protein